MTGELGFVASLAARLGSAPPGETWIGDDAAVVRPPSGPLLLAVDPMVAGVHFLEAGADVGWAAMARNVSDLAAMGGRPLHALVSLVVPPDADVAGVVDGLVEATAMCPIVGGDTSSGATLVVTVAVTGTVDGEPVLLQNRADVLHDLPRLGLHAAGNQLAGLEIDAHLSGEIEHVAHPHRFREGQLHGLHVRRGEELHSAHFVALSM